MGFLQKENLKIKKDQTEIFLKNNVLTLCCVMLITKKSKVDIN
jgi:hypothetical protein